MEEETSVSARKHARGEEQAALLKSKRALSAFHEKCLELVKEKNGSYLSPDDFTELLGGPSEVSPSFVKELLNTMVANVRHPPVAMACQRF
jgi:hypothetical protein